MQDPDRDSSVWVDLGDYESQTYVHSYAYPVGATRTIQVPVDHAVADEPAGWRSWVSIGVDFIPVVGNIKSAIDATTGRDFIAGEDLGALGRAAAAAGIFAGGLSKTAAKGAIAGAGAVTEAVARRAAKNADKETVQRWMSKAELEAIRNTGLIRGGREGKHFVTDAANRSARRARQRLALEDTPGVRVTMEVPGDTFTPPTRVQPGRHNGMPGGGMERWAEGQVPVTITRVDGNP